MDSLTQIILGAAIGEAVGGKNGKQSCHVGSHWRDHSRFRCNFTRMDKPRWRCIASSWIFSLHRFCHSSCPYSRIPHLSIVQKRFEYRTWFWLFFGSIITHPMLDVFTNYGTQFFWPFDLRLTFNSVFVVDPLYTLPFDSYCSSYCF